MAETTDDMEAAREAAADGGVISVMPETLANKIAAGEVVQRPASVAKELMENALDAGAGQVELIVKKAGRELVQVVDDGCGMSRADAERCFQRHATSKIRSVEDLERIQTLGFRGEALASIGSVAQVDLKTRRVEDEAGTRVRIEGGTTTTVQPCPHPGGTAVAVRNLFYNVPARRNFLKTPATEFKHLVETFQSLALAHPWVTFVLTHNDNEVYRLRPASGEDFLPALRQRVKGLLGEAYAGHLVPVGDQSSYLSVRGLVGAPERSRRSRREQFLFVNERYVEDRYLAHAVKAAYGDLLPEGAFPFFALFLELDPRRVDVNVHPTKAEIKFEDQSGAYGFVRSAVRRALNTQDLTPQLVESRPARLGDAAPPDEGEGRAARGASSKALSGDSRDREVSSSEAPMPQARSDSSTSAADFPAQQAGTTRGSAAGKPSSRPPAPQTKAGAAPGDLSEQLYGPAEETEEGATDSRQADTVERPCWQVNQGYIVVLEDDGLRIVDQQAAHRRVLYERACRRLAGEAQEGASQQLLFSCTVELPASEAGLFEELLPDLRRLGFDIERFSGRTVAVRGVPAGTREDQAQELLEEVLAQYRTLAGQPRLDRTDALARSVAQRGAVAGGQRLSDEEMRALLKDLGQCEMPYADPRGHPTMARLSADEMGAYLKNNGR